MADVISYEELRRIQTLERENKVLQDLEPSFFKKVQEYIKTKEKIIEENKNSDNVFSKQIVEKNENELKNIKKIIEDICGRRRRKIILQALNNISARVHNTEHMLPEEEELYNRTIEIIRTYTDSFISKFEKALESPKPEIEEKSKQEENKDFKKLKLTDSIPEFLWKDNQKYGPYEKEQEVELPKEVGEILIKEGKAIEINEK